MTCSSCGANNPPDASFCVSCGAALGRTCASCGASLPDDARYCPKCGAAVETIEAVVRGEERKLVTVLFADVTGSTTIGEQLDPERLRDVLSTYFDAMRAEIEAEGGTVEKFIGDAVMAVFGVPTAHEDDAGRAVRAAQRMLARLGQVNEELRRVHDLELRIRIGVHTGEVLATIDVVPGEPMVTGDAVNTAARLQTAAEPGQIVASARTVRSAPGTRWAPLPALSLKGKAEPVDAVVVLGSRAGSDPRGVPGLSAPIVGRDRELDLIRTTFERSKAEQRPHLVTIYGEPGVGKSRLTKEFLTQAREADTITIVQGRCLPYGDGVAYWPLAEILKATAGIDDRDPPDVVVQKIRDGAMPTAADTEQRERTLRALAFTIGVEASGTSVAVRDPRQVRAEMHDAWRDFFSSMAADRPAIVVIEDIHWADAAMLDLLEHVADRADGALLIACPARPSLLDRRPAWGGGRRNASSISLDPLSADDADRLMSLLLDVEELPDHVRHTILGRAEGNPFFLEEILRQLIDEARIVRDGLRWRASESIADVRVPDTVQGVLAARIDLLNPDERRALEFAAVVGRVFWPGPILRLLNGSGQALGSMLERLEVRDLVRSRIGSSVGGEREFIFKHVLIRDVAYERLPRADRSRAHAEVADWIESTATDRADFDELLGYHYEEAFRAAAEDPRSDPERREHLRRQAFTALLTAADDARARFCIAQARGSTHRAGALVVDPLERALVLEEFGRIARTNYEGDEEWRSFPQAVETRLTVAPDDHAAIARSCAWAIEAPTRWPGSMSLIPPEVEVRRLLEIGLRHAGDEPSETRIRLLTGQSMIPFAYGPIRGLLDTELTESRAIALRAAEMARELGRPDLESAALDATSSTTIMLGRYGDDLEVVEQRLRLLDQLDDAWETGDTYAMASWTSAMVGRYQRAWEYADAGRRAMEDTEAESLLLHALSWQAFAGVFLGRWAAVTGDICPAAERYLGDRRAEPPYFTQNLFGATAVIASATGQRALLDRLIPIVDMLVEGRGGTGANSAMASAAWRAWIALREGDLQTADASLRLSADLPIRGHWPLLLGVRALRLADPALRSEVDPFLHEMRPWASDAGIEQLASSFDRLEGTALLADGDIDAGRDLLTTAVHGFEALEGRWDAACTRLVLARAHLAVGEPDRADLELTSASRVLEELGALDELAVAGELRDAVRGA